MRKEVMACMEKVGARESDGCARDPRSLITITEKLRDNLCLALLSVWLLIKIIKPCMFLL